MRSVRAFAFAVLLLALLPATAGAASAAPIQTEEIAITYHAPWLSVFEQALVAKGASSGLPLLDGAQQVKVRGAASTRRAGHLLVTGDGGNVVVTYRVRVHRGVYSFKWPTPSAIGTLLLFTGPSVHPSGLGMQPFKLNGLVTLGGRQLTSFSAHKIKAGDTLRWDFLIGHPGRWIAQIATGLSLVLPLAAAGLWILHRRRRALREP